MNRKLLFGSLLAISMAGELRAQQVTSTETLTFTRQVTVTAPTQQQVVFNPATMRLNNAQATIVMNRLQDALGKPRVTSGVWYVNATDTYHWIGPKFGRHMAEPASQFLDEVGPYIY